MSDVDRTLAAYRLANERQRAELDITAQLTRLLSNTNTDLIDRSYEAEFQIKMLSAKIEQLTGERDRARDTAARYEAQLALTSGDPWAYEGEGGQ